MLLCQLYSQSFAGYHRICVRSFIAHNSSTTYKFSDEERAKFEAIAEQVTQEWIANTEAAGLPGTDLYNLVLDLIEKTPANP